MATALHRSMIKQCWRPLLHTHYRYLRTNTILKCADKTEDQKGNGPNAVQEKSFEELLESSPLMQMRRPQGRAVTGKITHIYNDDIYIDFGAKFQFVAKKPAMNPEQYEVGKNVRILLKKLEMTGHFLGQSKHITLLEADGQLLGLDYKQPSNS